MLLVCKADCEKTGLAFIGCETPCFWFAPCCFALIVNNLYFLNISFGFLVARRIGFPYPRELFLRAERGGLEGEFLPGRERVMRPLLKRTFSLEGTEIYQPMFPYQVTVEELRKFYGTPYVHERSLEWEKGLGGVFIQKDGRLLVYSREASLEWVPQKVYERNIIHKEVGVEILQWQLYVQGLWPSPSNVPEHLRQRAKTVGEVSKRFNKKMLERTKKGGIGGFENGHGPRDGEGQ